MPFSSRFEKALSSGSVGPVSLMTVLLRPPGLHEVSPAVLQIRLDLFPGKAGRIRHLFRRVTFDIEELQAAPLVFRQLLQDGPDLQGGQYSHFAIRRSLFDFNANTENSLSSYRVNANVTGDLR